MERELGRNGASAPSDIPVWLPPRFHGLRPTFRFFAATSTALRLPPFLIAKAPPNGHGVAHVAATYAMLAAESLGLGSCLLGTTVALEHDSGFKAKHGIPKQDKITLGLTIGHPKTRFRRTIHRQLASVHFV